MGNIRNVITMSESGRLNRCLKQNGTCRGKKVNGLHKLATDWGMPFRFLTGPVCEQKLPAWGNRTNS